MDSLPAEALVFFGIIRIHQLNVDPLTHFYKNWRLDVGPRRTNKIRVHNVKKYA